MSYLVMRNNGAIDRYPEVPTMAEFVRRQVTPVRDLGDDCTGTSLTRVALGERVRLAAWVNADGNELRLPYNVIGSCVAHILGGPRIAYPGDMVFTRMGDNMRFGSLDSQTVSDLEDIHYAVSVVLRASGRPTVLQEAIAGRVRRWAGEIPALPRPAMTTIQLPGAPG